jgi:hypothetical protein
MPLFGFRHHATISWGALHLLTYFDAMECIFHDQLFKFAGVLSQKKKKKERKKERIDGDVIFSMTTSLARAAL